MMTDECEHCSVRGRLRACLKTPCNIHGSWLVKSLLKKIKKLEMERERKE